MVHRLRSLMLAAMALVAVCRGQNLAARVWLNQYNIDAEGVYYAYSEADWTYNTNLTDYNMGNSVSASFTKRRWCANYRTRGSGFESIIN